MSRQNIISGCRDKHLDISLTSLTAYIPLHSLDTQDISSLTMSRHQYDLIQCMKQPGKEVGLVCPQCDGRCPICDSYVKANTRVRICQECSFGHLQNRCIVCSNFLGDNKETGTPAYYCFECVLQEKDREGCPRVINVGSLKSDMISNKRAKPGNPNPGA